ncbi:hypothetical protein AALO_G00283480 [Alosa alosa]|uniref:Uncharacterized protein n=1 Tax=Alosa alosa TaxID=278164 RepID=A0AAV6FPV3_9TELE|nr:hypothetical protein AALO_G00283480 [Alosa alosa]
MQSWWSRRGLLLVCQTSLTHKASNLIISQKALTFASTRSGGEWRKPRSGGEWRKPRSL